jgi:glycosyltransferase involved in cell wall biosynthesis
MPLASILGNFAARLADVERRVISHRVPVWSIRPVLRVLDTIWAWSGVYSDVITVSDGVKASCAAYPHRLLERTVTIHNGLLGWMPSHLTRAAARERFAIADDQLALVAVGRLAEQKNYPLLLRVMEKVRQATLLVAGEGPLRGQLAGLAASIGVADRVRFLGSLPRTQIPDLLAAADIFVQPSIFEGQSNAVLEALQANLPVVAHDIPEQRETLAGPDGAVAGALVPLDDVDAWAAAIETLRWHGEAACRAREAAARRAALFTFDRMVSGFERVLTAPSLRSRGRASA